MTNDIPTDYRRPRSPSLVALHDRYGIGTDPEATAEYMQAVDDAREVQEVAEERDMAIAERDAAQGELAEARRLLAMASSFDAGPLLLGAPKDWTCWPLTNYDTHWAARITPLIGDHGPYWEVSIDHLNPEDGRVLTKSGEWLPNHDGSEFGFEAFHEATAFDSPTAALAALDAWRAARRAEIAGVDDGVGRGEMVTQTEEQASQ